MTELHPACEEIIALQQRMAQFWTTPRSGPKCSREASREEFNHTYVLPLEWNREINGSLVAVSYFVISVTFNTPWWPQNIQQRGQPSDTVIEEIEAAEVVFLCFIHRYSDADQDGKKGDGKIRKWGGKGGGRGWQSTNTAANFPRASSDKNRWFLLRALALYLPSHISLRTEEGHFCTGRTALIWRTTRWSGGGGGRLMFIYKITREGNMKDNIWNIFAEVKKKISFTLWALVWVKLNSQ